MKRLLFLCFILVITSAKKEEPDELDKYLSNSGIWRYIEKRLGVSPNEKGSDDEEPKTRIPPVLTATSTQTAAKANKLDEHNYVKSDDQPNYVKVQPSLSRVDSLGNRCLYNSSDNLIIRSKASLSSGAFYLKSFSEVTGEQCAEYCCYTQGCNLAVFENKDENNCYLFNCGSPSKCLYASHSNYTTMAFPTHGLPSVSESKGQQKTHENELHGLNKPTTKQPTTTAPTPPPRHTVPLFGKCYIDWNDKCADPNSHCLDDQCRCVEGYKPKFGFCRKICEHDMFECNNKGQSGNVPDCIDRELVCDGTSQCADESDEQSCPDKVKEELPKKTETDSKDGDQPSKEEPKKEQQSSKFTDSQRPGPPQNVRINTKTSNKVIVEWDPSEASPCCPVMAYSVDIQKTNGYKSKVNNFVIQADTLKKVLDNLEPDTNYTISIRAYSIKSGASFRSRITVLTDGNGNQANTETKKNSSVSRTTTTQVITASPTTMIPTVSTPKPTSKPKHSNSSNIKKGSNTVIVEEEVDKVVVESPTDSNEGPIVALALGLGITLMLLVFVGCRLRTVKRRIRKGRALHSNEADYLINGMYL